MMTILVTGGASFTGSNLVSDWMAEVDEKVITFDTLICAGSPSNLHVLGGSSKHIFVTKGIGDQALIGSLFLRHRPRAVINFSAESHIERSTRNPKALVQTNNKASIKGGHNFSKTILKFAAEGQNIPLKASAKHIQIITTAGVSAPARRALGSQTGSQNLRTPPSFDLPHWKDDSLAVASESVKELQAA